MRRSLFSFIVILAFGVGAAIVVVKKGNDAADEIQRLRSGIPIAHRIALTQLLDDELEKNINISNWKTYRNEKYGFEMKYPEDWYYSGGGKSHSQYLLCFNPTGFSGDCSMLLTINWNTTMEVWIKNFVKKSNGTIEESVIEVDGVAGKKFVIEKSQTHIFIEKNGLIYHFIKALSDKKFNGFLSSFEFIK